MKMFKCGILTSSTVMRLHSLEDAFFSKGYNKTYIQHFRNNTTTTAFSLPTHKHFQNCTALITCFRGQTVNDHKTTKQLSDIPNLTICHVWGYTPDPVRFIFFVGSSKEGVEPRKILGVQFLDTDPVARQAV